MEVVINRCYGRFELSKEALKYYKKISKNDKIEDEYDIERNDIYLVKTVKKLKKKANGYLADLKIVKIPDNIKWILQEYDGMEHIAEAHRTWP